MGFKSFFHHHPVKDKVITDGIESTAKTKVKRTEKFWMLGKHVNTAQEIAKPKRKQRIVGAGS